MAGFMKLCPARCLCLMVGGIFFLPLAHAQVLPDPTRPALIELALPQAGQGSQPQAGPRLESVLISPQRKLAIISGETYRLGQMVGAAKLVQISAHAVVLQQDGKQQVLALYPGLEKKNTGKK